MFYLQMAFVVLGLFTLLLWLSIKELEKQQRYLAGQIQKNTDWNIRGLQEQIHNCF